MTDFSDSTPLDKNHRVLNIATDSTDGEVRWTTRFIDSGGTAYPGSGTMSNHHIVLLGTEGAPLIDGTAQYDDAYPAHFAPAAITVTPGYWFRADVTEGMTFDSGDKYSGGVVSSWEDLFGNLTATSAISGDDPVDFHPNKRGFPCITGGNSVTPQVLESNTLSATNAMSRMWWSVSGHRDGDTDSAPWGLAGNQIYATRDLNDSVSFMEMGGGPSTAKSYGIPGSGTKGITINVWVWDANGGSPYDTQRYTQGFRHPDQTTTSSYGTLPIAVGGLSTSNFDSDSYAYEAGNLGFGAPGAIPTDDEIQTFIKHLCNRYGVDYMPDNTPWLISATANSTANYTVFDMPYHYRFDEGKTKSGDTITDMELKEPTASVHSRVINDTDGMLAPDHNINLLDRDGGTFVQATGESLRDATGYVWYETSVFTPVQTGVSIFCVNRNNSKINHGTTWEGGAILRQNGTTGGYAFRSSGNTLGSTVDHNGEWCLVLCTYDTTSGDQNIWVNDDTVVNTTDGSPSRPSTTRPNIGASNSKTVPNDCDVLEVAEFKHVLTPVERDNLRRYAKFRYASLFDT